MRTTKKHFRSIVIKDPHIRLGFNRPAGRTATFEEDILAKFDFIKKYGEDNQIHNLIFTGDVFDVKALSKYTMKQIKLIRDLLKNLNQQFRIFSISGNHDMPFASREMKKDSIYQFFVEEGYITDLHGKTLEVAENITLSGIDYCEMEQFKQEIKELNERLDKNKKNIVVYHEHTLPMKETEFFIDYVDYGWLSQFENIKVFIAGHLHRGFKSTSMTTWTDDDEDLTQYFINPFNLTRLARNYYTMNEEHIPTLVDMLIATDEASFNTLKLDQDKLDKEELIYIKDIAIPHKSFDEAFIKNELKQAMKVQMDIDSFKNSLKDSDGISSEDNLVIPAKLKEKAEYYLSLAKD